MLLLPINKINEFNLRMLMTPKLFVLETIRILHENSKPQKDMVTKRIIS